MALTLPIAINNYVEPMDGERRLLVDIYFAGLPIWISLAIVLATSIVVGLPIHFFLQWKQIGSRTYYVLAGTIGGCVVFILVLVAIEAVAGFWMVPLGAFSGAMTALSWSKSLETSD